MGTRIRADHPHPPHPPPSSVLLQPLYISQELSPGWGLSRWPWRSQKLTVNLCREAARWNRR